MLIGQSLLLPQAGRVHLYSPWFPRQGDAFGVVYQVLRQSAGGWSVDVEVQTKNKEDTDSSALSLGTLTITSVATSQLHVSACLELVRYHYELQGASGSDVWIHSRSNPPIWEPN